MSDQLLIERLRRGEAQAFREFYTAYADLIYRLSLRLLLSREEAEDATQEIFCKLLAALPEWRGEAALSSWIYRITLNHGLNVQRQKRRARWFSLDWLESQPDAAVDTLTQQVEVQEREALLLQAINKLPEKQRTALILHRFEGRSHQEIATIEQCSITAVESRLFQAKKNLSKILLPLLNDTRFA